MNFSLQSKLHPPKQKDLSKWSTWYRDVVEFGKDLGVSRVSVETYRDYFTKGMSPRDTAQVLSCLKENHHA